MAEVQPILEIEDAISPDLHMKFTLMRLRFTVCVNRIGVTTDFDFSEEPFFLDKNGATQLRDMLTAWLEES